MQEKKSSKFYLHKYDDGTVHLDKNHAYFFQCQKQMLVTEQYYYCDFVAWALMGDIHTERILFDENFMELQLEKAERVFWLAVVPELLAKRYSYQKKHYTTPV